MPDSDPYFSGLRGHIRRKIGTRCRFVYRLALVFWLVGGVGGTASSSDRPIVLAAASLTAVLADWQADPEIGAFTPITASSGALARHILSGAPADIFLSADPIWSEAIRDLSTWPPQTFALNQLAVIKPQGMAATSSPRRGLAVYADSDLVLAIGDPAHVPVGRYAEQALKKSHLWAPLSAERRLRYTASVQGVLALVARGEVDGGIVYATDIDRMEGIEHVSTIDPELHTPIRYTATLLRDTHEAAILYDQLTGTTGAKALHRQGFGPLSDGGEIIMPQHRTKN